MTDGIKKKNHTVTRGFLNNWSVVDPKSNNKVIWYFDILKQEIASSGKKASFAISDYIYVPETRAGMRNEVLENWFAETEGDFCDFSRLASFGPPNRRLSQKYIGNVLKCFIGLSFRSFYQLRRIREEIAQLHPEMEAITLELEVLNNCYGQITTFFEMARMLRITVYYGVQQALITQDQSCINLCLRDPPIYKMFMALSPSCVLVAELDDAIGMTQNFVLNWEQANSNHVFFREFNKNMLTTAREWVVFPNHEAAQTYASYLSAELVEQRTRIDAARHYLGVDSERIFPI